MFSIKVRPCRHIQKFRKNENWKLHAFFNAKLHIGFYQFLAFVSDLHWISRVESTVNPPFHFWAGLALSKRENIPHWQHGPKVRRKYNLMLWWARWTSHSALFLKNMSLSQCLVVPTHMYSLSLSLVLSLFLKNIGVLNERVTKAF